MIFEELLKDYTSLKPIQRKKIINLLKKFDNSDELIYEIIGLLKKLSYKDVLNDLENGKLGWNSIYYKEQRNHLHLQDSQLENPPKIQDGEIECPKCKSTQTMVIEMQTRSADEGFTYYINCFNPNCRKVTKT